MTIDVTPDPDVKGRRARTGVRDVHPQRRASLRAAAAATDTQGVRWVPMAALGFDLIAIALALLGAGVGRMTLPVFAPPVGDLGPTLVLVAPLVVVGWVLAILVSGGYAPQVFGAGTGEYRRVLNSSLANVAVIGVTCYLFDISLSRGWFLLIFLLGIPMLIAGRAWLRAWLKRQRQGGRLLNRVLLVGDARHVEDIADVLRREQWIGYDVVGAAAPASEGEETTSGIKILGDTSDLRRLASEAKVNVVVFAGGAVSSSAQLRQIAWELEDSDVQVVVAPSLTDVSSERVTVRPVGGLPLLHLEKPRAANAARLGKRSFDAVGSSVLLLLLAPVFAVAALQIWLHDRGPVFFRQERIGKDGQAFQCWKFRTMVADAEALLAKVHEDQGSDKGVFVKIKNDPRVTTPGRWLRRFSLDELPQLFNVWRGEMSLVGPRPQVAHEVALYDDAMSRRLHVRPGMTGLWQVSGRSDLSLDEAIRLDLYYVDNWSMVQDLSILVRTVRAVTASHGAY